MAPKHLALQAVNQWIAQMSESEQRRMMWGSVMAKDELVEQLCQTITTALTAQAKAAERRTWEEAAQWLQEFTTRKPTIAELEFILERKGEGPQAQIQPDGTVLMNDPVVISLAVQEFRHRAAPTDTP